MDTIKSGSNNTNSISPESSFKENCDDLPNSNQLYIPTLTMVTDLSENAFDNILKNIKKELTYSSNELSDTEDEEEKYVIKGELDKQENKTHNVTTTINKNEKMSIKIELNVFESNLQVTFIS